MTGLEGRDWTVPPGETLAEALEERDMSQTMLAEQTGFSLKHVNLVINGRAGIGPEFALALERVLGISAEFWVTLSARWELDCHRSAAGQGENDGSRDG